MIFLLIFLKESLVSDIVFWSTALFGTTLFVIRLCVTMIGGLTDEWAEGDDVMVEDGAAHHQTGSFKLFTLHSLSGFFMMFGWIGLACTKQLHYSQAASMVYALLAGGVTMILTAFIFKWSRLLVSRGTRFDIEKTIGLVGTVYQRISDNEPGKIHVVVDGSFRELLALSTDGDDIESFCVVRVVRVLDYETVIVQRV